MSPLGTRQARRRRAWSTVLIVVAVGLFLAVIIGGAFRVSASSRPYWRSVNRSFAQQASLVVAASNESGSQLRSLLNEMPALSRPVLQARLDSLVRDTGQESAWAASLDGPSPSVDAADRLAAVMSDRADAAANVRHSVYGLIDMSPAAVTGSTPASAAGSAAAPTVSPTAAADELMRTGRALQAADRAYGALRQQFALQPGHPRLPTSKWITDARQWSASSVGVLVGLIPASASLAALHQLALDPNSVSLTPPTSPGSSVPSADGAPAGVAILPPTPRVSASLVVQNTGNVAEKDVKVTSTLQGPSGPAETRATRVDVPAGGSAVAVLPASAVEAGATGEVDTLTLAVDAPAGQVDTTGLSTALSFWVAPATTGLPRCLATPKVACQGSAAR